jgi:hypothetical protein
VLTFLAACLLVFLASFVLQIVHRASGQEQEVDGLLACLPSWLLQSSDRPPGQRPGTGSGPWTGHGLTGIAADGPSAEQHVDGDSSGSGGRLRN